jgi:hypothetical protein
VFISEINGNDAVFAARRRAGTGFGDVGPVAATALGGPTVTFEQPDVALDGEGNGFAVWQRRAGTTSTAQVAAFDPVAPAITAADVPATATAGQPVTMTAAATDRMSRPALRFDFGDGSGAEGDTAQHAYAAPGNYTVTVTASDAAGNRSTTARAIQVAPAPVAPFVAGGPTGPTGPLSLTATAGASWDRLRNGRTRMKTLRVEGLTGPEVVQLKCQGKGCRKPAKRTVRRHGRAVNFTQQVKGMVLRPGAKLTVTVTRAGHIGRVFSYTMVRRKDPKKQTRCQSPGAKRLAAC